MSMALVAIRERSLEEVGSWRGVLDFDGEGEYPISVSDPFSEPEEQLLRWFFERHLEFPFGDQDLARIARQSIVGYGEALFQQVFSDRDAYARYRSLVERGFEGVRVEVSGSPEFQRLHWEALKDPGLPEPLALRLALV